MSTRITKPGLLFARCDNNRAWVLRTEQALTHPLYTLVNEHIQANGLVQAVSEKYDTHSTDSSPNHWTINIYTKTETRNSILTDIANAEDTPDVFKPCPLCDHYHDPDTTHHAIDPEDCTDCLGLHR